MQYRFFISGILGGLIVVSGGILFARQSPQDQEVLQDVLRQVKQDTASGLTQSEALLTVPSVEKKLDRISDLFKNKKIIHDVFANERRFKDTHYVFYTAIPHMRLFQDVTRKLYKRKVGDVGALKDKEFQFIRYTYNDPAYSQYSNVQNFLIKEISDNGIIDDRETRLRTILVSTNLSLFGNLGIDGESTWHYLNNPQSWAVPPVSWLQDSLKSFGYPIIFTQKIMALADLIKQDQGDLFQIFVPKESVDSVGYLCWRLGIPLDKEWIEKVFERDPVTLGGSDKIFFDEVNEKLYRFKRDYKMGKPREVGLAREMIQHVKDGKYAPSRGLELYKNDPKNLFAINYQQGRLLITNSMLLNPDSGIKIIRHSNLQPKKLAEYKKRLRMIMLEMDAYKKRISK